MDAKTKRNEATSDLERQPLLLPSPRSPPTAADHKPSGCSCDCELARAAHTSPATAARTLALVTATAGLAFVVDLAARGEQVYLEVFVAVFLVACASSSLLAWCVAMKAPVSPSRHVWPGTAAARVLLWSFAMALVQTMTTFASLRAPRAEWALSTVAWLVGSLCFAEIVPWHGFRWLDSYDRAFTRVQSVLLFCYRRG